MTPHRARIVKIRILFHDEEINDFKAKDVVEHEIAVENDSLNGGRNTWLPLHCQEK